MRLGMPIIKRLLEHKILLDTHVWLGLVSGDFALSQSFISATDRAVQHQKLLVSAISIWEIGMLVQKKRISLDKDPLEWVDVCLDNYGFKLVPLSPKIAIESTRLPHLTHADPADRMLLATALEENAVLATCDQTLLSYSQEGALICYNPKKESSLY